MALGKETREMLALKLPRLAPFAEELEEIMTEISEKGDGWGRISLDSQGLDEKGNLLIRFFDQQIRRFRSKLSKKEHWNKRIT
jgi:hypothetical protein